MAFYLGIDTSNYTTSLALYDDRTGRVAQQKKLLSVKSGQLGLKQSDAVFLHTKQIPDLIEQLFFLEEYPIDAVAASVSPRNEEGSYMPCFLVGATTGRAIAASIGVPFHKTSHQAGHIAAALYSTGQTDLFEQEFLAFHFSGGTSQVLLVKPEPSKVFHIQTIAETLDLNAGQAVDRVGGMLGLPFPSGKALEELALQSSQSYSPKIKLKGYNCCLSGLENQCADRISRDTAADVAKYCLDYLGETITEITCAVTRQYPGLPLVYAGGVMSNSIIKERLQREFEASFAAPEFSCDNAAGVALLCCIQNGGALFC